MGPIALGALAGGGLGLLQGQNNERKMYQDMMLKAEMAKYAPYSAMAQSIASAPSKDLAGQEAALFGGAATGASMGNLMNGAAAKPTGKWSNMDFMTDEQLTLLEQQQKMQTTA